MMHPGPDQGPPPGDPVEPGVYRRARPLPLAGEDAAVVPPFPSPGFWRFLAGFLSAPTDNPLFAREWILSRRRLGPAGRLALPLLAAASLAVGMAGAPVAAAAVAPLVTAGQKDLAVLVVYGFLLLLHFAAVLLALLRGIGAATSPGRRAMLAELNLTTLRPEDAAWGTLAGLQLLQVPPFLALLPTVLGVPVTLEILGDPPPALQPGGMWLFAAAFFPHLAASQFLATSIGFVLSQEVPGGGTEVGLAVLVAVLAGFVFGVALLWGALLSFPLGAAPVMAVLVVVKFASACALLHHLSRRYAQARLATD
jgi:hypothetical protein